MQTSRDISSSNRTTFPNGRHDERTRVDALIISRKSLGRVWRYAVTWSANASFGRLGKIGFTELYIGSKDESPPLVKVLAEGKQGY